LIETTVRKEVHLRIGRLLVKHWNLEEQQEHIFELVDHLNEGADLLTDTDERRSLANLNLIAGRKAQQATAYTAARTYFEAGMRMLPNDGWSGQYALTFALHLGRAEAEYLSGNFEAAERFIALALEGARTPPEKAEVYRLLIVKNTLQAKYLDAIEAGRNALALLGVDLPRTGLDAALGAELEQAA
jgi:predicted ATPase